MPRSEELRVIGETEPSTDGSYFVFAADKQTQQISFEPLDDILVESRTRETMYLSARSLGRRVRGFINTDQEGRMSGELDFVTPLRANETEDF